MGNYINTIQLGDCLDLLKTMPENCIDAIITDPPYGLSFMGKKWDYDVPSVDIWKECLRIIKPGGYLLSFAGTRTQHRMACNIEDGGFEIRDMIAWVYGSGFPKSLNIGKAIDKLQGNERKVVGEKKRGDVQKAKENGSGYLADPANRNNVKQFGYGIEVFTQGTSEWEGWGTALKPALEPITVARKPISEKTIAENIIKWGTGGVNINECRVPVNPNIDDMLRTVSRKERVSETWKNGSGFHNETNSLTGVPPNGRFPANIIHDGSDDVLKCFPDSKGQCGDLIGHDKNIQSPNGIYGTLPPRHDHIKRGDNGSASRFFYCAKTSKSERGNGNNHPTVKPIKLIEYLIKLISREGAIILDPFGGSGTTALACINLNRKYILMEKDEHYYEIANKRINEALKNKQETQQSLF